MKLTYKEQFKVIIYEDGQAIGSIRKNGNGDKYRYAFHEAHGGGKGEWLDSLEEVQMALEKL